MTSPKTLTAAGGQSGQYSPFFQTVYDPLLRAAPDGTVGPGLASAWQYNDDKTQLTLTLREGVTFSDGTAFDAAAAKANMDAFLKDGIGKSYLASVTGVTAPDAHTLVLTLKAADPGLLVNLADATSYMQSPATLGKAEAATDPIGTGPYVMDKASTVIGSTYVYKANPKYWDPSKIHYGKITLNVYTTATAEVNAVKSGQIDAGALVTNQVAADVKAVSGWTVQTQPLDLAGMFIYDRAARSTRRWRT
ncbi:ABC transporter substrate-binding protein [Catenulispora yoronensis]